MEASVLPSITVRLTGVSPLIMHNCRPFLNHTTQAYKDFKSMTASRKKTDKQLSEISAAEWRMGLYLNSDGKPIIPGENLERMLIEGARKSRSGKQATAGIIVSDSIVEHDGPDSIDDLAQDQRFVDIRPVVIQRARIMRCRPIFPVWQMTIHIEYIPSSLNKEVVLDALRFASTDIGIGDYRPKFGRFTYEILAQTENKRSAA